jgi:hypothetical protein
VLVRRQSHSTPAVVACHDGTPLRCWVAAGVSLERGLGLLWPGNLIGLVRLVWNWVRRPRMDVLAMPGHNKGILGFNVIWLYDQASILLHHVLMQCCATWGGRRCAGGCVVACDGPASAWPRAGGHV